MNSYPDIPPNTLLSPGDYSAGTKRRWEGTFVEPDPPIPTTSSRLINPPYGQILYYPLPTFPTFPTFPPSGELVYHQTTPIYHPLEQFPSAPTTKRRRVSNEAIPTTMPCCPILGLSQTESDDLEKNLLPEAVNGTSIGDSQGLFAISAGSCLPWLSGNKLTSRAPGLAVSGIDQIGYQPIPADDMTAPVTGAPFTSFASHMSSNVQPVGLLGSPVGIDHSLGATLNATDAMDSFSVLDVPSSTNMGCSFPVLLPVSPSIPFTHNNLPSQSSSPLVYAPPPSYETSPLNMWPNESPALDVVGQNCPNVNYLSAEEPIYPGLAIHRHNLPGSDCNLPRASTRIFGPARRGPYQDRKKREETALTRVLGVCIRCKIQKIRCEKDPNDPTGDCLTCQHAKPNTKIWRVPCLRYKIPDIQLFKPSNGVAGLEWTKRWSHKVDSIATWQSVGVRTIRVSEGYTDGYVELKVRQFRPLEGDKLERTWDANGVTKRVKIPAYAICNIKEAKQSYERYIEAGVEKCVTNVLKSRKCGHGSEMLGDVYSFAFARQKELQSRGDKSNELVLLQKTLQLWVAIRLSTKSCIIVGDETLGMPRDIMDSSSPLHNMIPLPPVMGAQIDLILIDDIQASLRKEVLDTFQSMNATANPKVWLSLFLVTFILLHNIAMITAHDAGYAKKHGLRKRFARPEKVREYYMGANILLGYFHYGHKGKFPFSSACSDRDLRELADLDETKLAFVHRIRAYVSEHASKWDELVKNQEYEDDFYHIGQMFKHGWTPSSMVCESP